MNISKSRRIKFNLGHYESYEVSAQATLTHDDLGYSQDEVIDSMDIVVKAMYDKAEEILDVLLVDDIRSATDLTEEKRSILLRAFTTAPEATKRK